VVTRVEAVEKHIENSFIVAKVVRDLSNTIAEEIEAHAEMIKESGDLYNLYGGLIKAAQVIRTTEETVDA
jgi:hypothetical protein